VACFTLKDIDLKFSTIRKEQSPYLEFLVSIYRHETGADIAMMNCGNFRMDTYIKAGPITFGVIENVITDKVVVKLVPGGVLVEALENNVSMYPNLAGRYSAFSGISFNWDASQKPGERVIVESIHVH
jgi:5'-nucleotidase